MSEEKPIYKMSVSERIDFLKSYANLSDEETALLGGFGTLGEEKALKENVIGVYDNLTLGFATGLVVNGKEYVLPMAIEEPSVIAAQSNANKIMKRAGGFKAELSDPWYMISQIQLTKIENYETAIDAIKADKDNLLKIANEVDPKLVGVGGGARGLKVRYLPTRKGDMVITHLYVDTKDAMGANAVNSMAEAVAPRIEELTGGKVYLRILSNLADKRLARASIKIPFDMLETKVKVGDEERTLSGTEVADAIEYASAFADADPYRAATHNKGIMNAVDAIAVAFGQDWRALEAGAHEYAYYANKDNKGDYTLSSWYVENDGLKGVIEMPCAVGIVGGAAAVNPQAKLSRKIAKIESAGELAMVMTAAGLAENFSAIKALSTEGIQRGHMRLHARNIAIQAGATGDKIDYVTQQMIKNKRIKQDYAEELLESLNAKS